MLGNKDKIKMTLSILMLGNKEKMTKRQRQLEKLDREELLLIPSGIERMKGTISNSTLTQR
jgi:hypothetical protein